MKIDLIFEVVVAGALVELVLEAMFKTNIVRPTGVIVPICVVAIRIEFVSRDVDKIDFVVSIVGGIVILVVAVMVVFSGDDNNKVLVVGFIVVIMERILYISAGTVTDVLATIFMADSVVTFDVNDGSRGKI